MTTLAPYDAVLVVSYGGPRGPEDVLPFMRNATRGRGVPDERLVEVSGHYQLFGGVSPINERNDELLDALRAELAARGVEVPVVIGNRNWTPFIADVLRSLSDGGAQRVLVVLTAAYASYSGCRQYREDLAAALDALGGGPLLDKIGPYAETDGFVSANAHALVAALNQVEALTPAEVTEASADSAEGLPSARRGPVLAGSAPSPDLHSARVLFVTHSIPAAMDAASGPGGPEGTYAAQHLRVAERVVAQAAESLGFAPEWELVYCSRSGAPHIPWLEPDVNDRLAELAAEGVTRVVAAPIGFINDHMEVVFDLDTQAHQTADGLGLEYVRAATAGTDPAFVGMLADEMLVRAAVARGEAEPRAGVRNCTATCCLSGRPGARPAPAACSSDPEDAR